MKLFMTIDLEDWYNAHDYAIPKEKWNSCESRAENTTRCLLELLSKYEVKAVFFVLGYIAERHPELVLEISAQGHKIGTHGYMHDKLYQMSREQLEQDIHRSIQLLKDITGKEIKHYRAPSWTFDQRTEYLHEILQKEGIQVDSSLQPFWTPLSGVAGAPSRIHYPVINHEKSKVLEFPAPVCEIGPLRFPFCGGLYLRMAPYWLIKKCLKRTLKKQDCFLYIHPWELDAKPPKHKASPFIKLIHNYGIRNMKNKLAKLFRDFEFCDPERFGVGEQIDEK